MSRQKQFERVRIYSLVGIFACSLMLSFSFLIRILYFMNHLSESFPYRKTFLLGDGVLIVIMLALVLWRHLRLNDLASREPSLRSVLKDERNNFNRMRAYRTAFFVLFITQLTGKGLMIVTRCFFDIPYQSEFPLSVAVMTVIGAYCIYSVFGRKHA